MRKVILVTGASQGLGKAISDHLHVKGYTVFGVSRNIVQNEHPFKVLQMDVKKEDSIRVAVDTIIESEGSIDVLINNAGVGFVGPTEILPISDVYSVFDTNFLGVLRTSQAVLPFMRKQQSGLIINVSSIASENGLPFRAIYSACKSALDRMTESLRIELAQFGVEACYVQPGAFRTNISSNRFEAIVPTNSEYVNSWAKCYAVLQERLAKRSDPYLLGPFVEKIISTKIGSIRRCYRIGRPIEKLSIFLKQILPDGHFDRMMKKYHGM